VKFRCNKCGFDKPSDNFYVKHKDRPQTQRSDWSSYCNDCMKQYKRDYYEKNAKRVNGIHKRRRNDNIEHYHGVEAAKRLAHSTNPEALLKRRKVASFDPRKRYLYDRTRQWKGSAKKRKLEWGLTLDDIENMLEGQGGKCHYTGLPLVLEANSQKTISLDRIDSSRGYVPSNVVLCCTFVNLAKLDMTVAEFREMVTILHEREW
jgi:hypothetical protein